MPNDLMFVEDYRTGVTFALGYPLRISSYRVASEFICVVDNTEAGATICRVSAGDRERAVRKAMTQASKHIVENQLQSGYLKTARRDGCADGTGPINYVLVSSGEDVRRMTVNDFISLPNSERMGHVLNATVEFVSEDGGTIPVANALEMMAQAR